MARKTHSGRSLFFRKESQARKEHDSDDLGESESLGMRNSRVWRRFIYLAALSLVIVPVSRPGESASNRLAAGKGSGSGSASPALLTGENPRETQEPAPGPQPSPDATAAVTAPVKPPQISYKDGQLTVIAENCALSDIMKNLRAVLKMDIDLPPGGTQQRVWVHLGPGPARRVLRDLLDSTEFNYVIQASEDTSDGIRSVLLTPRSKSVGSEDVAGRPEVAANRRNSRGTSSDDSPDAENVASAEAAVPAVAASVAPSVSSESPQLPSVTQGPPSAIANSSPNTSTGASTDDHIIQQLQSMYQQRRQIQVQQNQRNAAPAPNQ